MTLTFYSLPNVKGLSRERLKKFSQKFTELCLTKGRGWFINFLGAPIIYNAKSLFIAAYFCLYLRYMTKKTKGLFLRIVNLKCPDLLRVQGAKHDKKNTKGLFLRILKCPDLLRVQGDKRTVSENRDVS
jgi:hypothetical protein